VELQQAGVIRERSGYWIGCYCRRWGDVIAMSLSIINSMFLQNNSFICLSKLVHLLAHVDADKEMKCEVKGMKQSADSGCVVIPTMLL
jgi:hypothetical protein